MIGNNNELSLNTFSLSGVLILVSPLSTGLPGTDHPDIGEFHMQQGAYPFSTLSLFSLQMKGV